QTANFTVRVSLRDAGEWMRHYGVHADWLEAFLRDALTCHLSGSAPIESCRAVEKQKEKPGFRTRLRVCRRINHAAKIFLCVRKSRLLARSRRQNFTRRRWRLS